MKSTTSIPGFKPVRHDQLRQERSHDSYKCQKKPPEPSVCPDCGVIFHSGRWQSGQRPPAAETVICPACHRIRDQFPAGFLHVSGDFLAAHSEEILRLIQHHADKTKAEHPLARIMAIKNDDDNDKDALLITTTDIHLARDLGEALHHAYQGKLEFHYNESENLLRVHWRR